MEESLQRLQKEKAENEEKLFRLVKEKEEAEGRAKESEEKLGSARAGRLEAESKLLQAEVAHASCGSHIANLFDSAERAKQELKEKEEVWLAEKEKLVEGISEGFNTGVDQLRVFLQERYSSAAIYWEAVTIDDVLACDAGEEGGSEDGVEGAATGASGKGEDDGAKVLEVGKEEEIITEGMTKVGGVMIKELN